jgi:hypothetical protein
VSNQSCYRNRDNVPELRRTAIGLEVNAGARGKFYSTATVAATLLSGLAGTVLGLVLISAREDRLDPLQCAQIL